MKIKPLIRNKKGMAIGDLYPVILTIALVAILIAVVMLVLNDLGENISTSIAVAGNQTNESHTLTLTDAVFPLNAEDSNCSAYNFAINRVYNGSSTMLIDSGNYTLDATTGLVSNATDLGSTDTWLISYTWSHGGTACEATADVIDDFTEFIPWIGVILLIVAAAIVLGILIRNLAGGQRV